MLPNLTFSEVIQCRGDQDKKKGRSLVKMSEVGCQMSENSGQEVSEFEVRGSEEFRLLTSEI